LFYSLIPYLSLYRFSVHFAPLFASLTAAAQPASRAPNCPQDTGTKAEDQQRLSIKRFS
jgi:hypothetical protein